VTVDNGNIKIKGKKDQI